MTSGFIVEWFWGLERVESLRLLLLGLLFEVDLLGFSGCAGVERALRPLRSPLEVCEGAWGKG